MSKAKTTPTVQSKPGFNPKSYVKDHITEEDVIAAKASFDLFDSDQGGTVDIKCTSQFIQNSKLPWHHWVSNRKAKQYSTCLPISTATAVEPLIFSNGLIFSPNAFHTETQGKTSEKYLLCSMMKKLDSSHSKIFAEWPHNSDKISANRNYRSWSTEPTKISMVWFQKNNFTKWSPEW